MFIKENANRYFAVMKYTPGNAETGIYGDSADIVDVIIAKDESEAIEKFGERRDSTILDGSEYVVEINEDEYNQYLNDLEKMTEYESLNNESVIKEEKLNANDLKDFKYRIDYNTEYPGNFDDMISCAYNDANAICVRARMVNPKTGKLYINDSQFYVVKNLDDFNTLRLCAYEYGYKLSAPNEIDWDNYYTVDIFYPNKAGSYRVINRRKTESFDGKRRLRIARYNEFDNGKVLFNYDRMTIEDAEKLAKQKSIKDPTDIYYVKFDDIMNPTTDICWYQGKSYPSNKIDMVNGEIIIKKNKNMVRKLHIRENIISDLYGLKVINMDNTKQVITSYGFNSINLNDCSLVEIDKPRTYAAAKKSDFPILGMKDNYTLRQRWEPSKTGLAVMGIYGNDNFMSVAGDDRIRYNFEQCDKFYKAVPNDMDTYQRQSDIARNRTHTVLGKLNDAGEMGTKNTWDYDHGKNYNRNTLHKARAYTTDDLIAYDPAINRRRYEDILAKNHLERYITSYDDICKSVKDFQNRIKDIDVINNEYDFGRTIDTFKRLISQIKSLNYNIDKIKKSNADGTGGWFRTTENDLKSDIVKIEDTTDDLDDKLMKLGV